MLGRISGPFLLSLLLISCGAQAQQFLDSNLASSCGGKIHCDSPQVIGRDDRPRPSIPQPQATERTMGSCGSYLPVGQDFRPRLSGLQCGQVTPVIRNRLPLPIEQDRKDKADQLLSSSMDDLKKRTKAQSLLQSEIAWTSEFQIPLTETWTYSAVAGDFNGPAESYQTTCQMNRQEEYTVETPIYRQECTRWIEEDAPSVSPGTGGFHGGSSSGGSGGGYGSGSGSSRSNSDRMKGTGSDEIRQRSRDNYDKIRRKNGAQLIVTEPVRYIAQNRRCANWQKVYDHTEYETRRRKVSPVVGPCLAQRGTWRTYPVTLKGSRACPQPKVKIAVSFQHDPDWTPAHHGYLDILPNKFDLLPGEREQISVGLQNNQGLTPTLKIENAWNAYRTEVRPQSIACAPQDQNIQIEIFTDGRIKRKAPNPFSLPEDQKPLLGVDGKGRPVSLKLIDQARQLRLDQSLNSRRFEEDLGSTEAGGSKAFWVSTQFRMKLSKVDGWGRKFPVTLPNKFATDRTDVFDSEMLISLGGQGGMDRLYRPAGPLGFLFNGLYHYLGVELSPDTVYELEVKTAQREFPFYESTCKSGEVACGNENDQEDLFSEAITIQFKTEQTSRSFLKWLKDLQIIVY